MNEYITNDITEAKEPRNLFRIRDILFGILFFLWSQLNAVLLMAIQNGQGSSITIPAILLIASDTFLFWKSFNVIKKSTMTKEDQAPPMTPKSIFIIFGIAIAMIMMTSFVGGLLGVEETTNQNELNAFFAATPLLAAIHIILVAPICEDICFRYYFVRPGTLWKTRFIISGLLFLAVHMTTQDPLETAIAYAVPVCFLHGTRLAFGSVRYSLLLHMLYNMIIIVFMFTALKTG